MNIKVVAYWGTYPKIIKANICQKMIKYFKITGWKFKLKD